MLYDIIYILVGFLLLVKGGDYLVDSAVAIARRAKLSPMVIGLTVVGFGTSMPELLVSVQAALVDSPGIAIGNVVGSNIANIGLILGISALLCPLPASRSSLLIEMPFMVLACFLFVGIGMTGTIGRVPGIALFAMLVAFVSWQIRRSRKAEKAAGASAESLDGVMSLWKALPLLIVSFAALVWGADLLVDGASDIALQLGVSDRVIGLTIVAVGTSLPELFASVMAARKGQTDIAIGNIIGSVSFNVLSVIGLSAAICPIRNSSEGFAFDYLLMVAICLLLWFFMRTRHLLERWEGGVLLFIYVAYIVWTVVGI